MNAETIYTPAMTQPTDDGTRDFTIPMEPKRFRIDEDVFQAPAIISPIALKKLSALHASLGDVGALTNDLDRTLDIVGDLFGLLLPGPSGGRFKERLLSEEEPIDLQRQALPALYWLLEEYGMRPTQPSSASPSGSTDGPMDTPSGGTSSTDGASPETSTTSG
jgi:hypothetical protein